MNELHMGWLPDGAEPGDKNAKAATQCSNMDIRYSLQQNTEKEILIYDVESERKEKNYLEPMDRRLRHPWNSNRYFRLVALKQPPQHNSSQLDRQLRLFFLQRIPGQLYWLTFNELQLCKSDTNYVQRSWARLVPRVSRSQDTILSPSVVWTASFLLWRLVES